MTIVDAVSRLDLQSARTALSSATGAIVDVSGRVRKLVRRDGCKLIIEPDDPTDLIVFADCQGDAEIVRNSEIRKGSLVAVRESFNHSARRRFVCPIADCGKNRKETRTQKKHRTKTCSTYAMLDDARTCSTRPRPSPLASKITSYK